MLFGRETLNKGKLLSSALLPLALLAACGSDNDRENELRPPVPATVSVNVTEDRISVSPTAIGFTPQPRTEIIETPKGEELVELGGEPMPIEFTVANTLHHPVRLVVSGPERAVSRPVTPTGTLAMGVDLPTGSYTLSLAKREEEATTGKLRVGPLRVSPQNDLALP